MHKKTSQMVEPIIMFMLIIITVIEFLIYGGGIASGDILSALNVMIVLMLFGSTLVMTTILVRIYEYIIHYVNYYINNSSINYNVKSDDKLVSSSEEEVRAGSSTSTRKKKSTKEEKSKKRKV